MSADAGRLETLARQVGHWRPGVRRRAGRELRAAGRDAVAPLLHELMRRQHGGRLTQFTAVSFWPLFLVYQIIDVTLLRPRIAPFGSPLHRALGVVLAVLASALLAAMIVGYVQQRRARSYVHLLLGADDPDMLAPLLEALGSSDQRLARLAEQALTPVLSRITASHAAQLTVDGQTSLCRALDAAAEVYSKSFDPDFTVAAIHALEKLGDENAIPTVAKIANAGAPTRHKKRIRDAARAALPAMRERAKLQLPGNRLLRPSNLPDDTLLRAAGAASTSDETLLVRESDAEQ